MIRRTFHWVDSDNNGNDGWLIANAPETFGAAGAGFTIAHDALEHFTPSAHGELADELMALGALLLLRGPGNLLFSSAEVVLAEELQNLAPEFEWNEVPVPTQGHSPLRSEHAYVEEWIQEAFGRAESSIGAHWDEDGTEHLGEQMRRARGWVRYGYRRALRRYHGADPIRLESMFLDVQTQAELLMPGGEEGDRLIVEVDPRTLHADVHKVSLYD